jgi:hypothetical protein
MSAVPRAIRAPVARNFSAPLIVERGSFIKKALRLSE